MNKSLLISALAVAASAIHGAHCYAPKPVFNGNRRCPNCGKPTMSGTVCDLRCAVAMKRRETQQESEKGEII